MGAFTVIALSIIDLLSGSFGFCLLKMNRIYIFCLPKCWCRQVFLTSFLQCFHCCFKIVPYTIRDVVLNKSYLFLLDILHILEIMCHFNTCVFCWTTCIYYLNKHIAMNNACCFIVIYIFWVTTKKTCQLIIMRPFHFTCLMRRNPYLVRKPMSHCSVVSQSSKIATRLPVKSVTDLI